MNFPKLKLPKKLALSSLFLVSVLAVVFIGFTALPALQTHRYFLAYLFPLNTYDLFDLGVVDINADNQIDVFTTNHSARQSIEINQGNSSEKKVSDRAIQFQTSLTQLGLDQDTQFPNAEDTLRRPKVEKPGLYIYRYNRNLYLQSHLLDQSVSGKLTLSWPIELDAQQNAEADVKTVALLSNGTESTLAFKVLPSGLLAIKGKEDIVELPHHLSIESDLPTEQIFVGTDLVQPEKHEFEMIWRDRHSFAWADFDHDQQMDVFIARGGVKGRLNEVPEPIADEAMVMDNNLFDNRIEQLGFEKSACPGRQAAWVDFNQDNRLDLYIGCGRDSQPTHPNQLYQQQPDGQFVDVAAQFGLDFPEDGVFQWLDVDADGDMDLLSIRDHTLWLYSQTMTGETRGFLPYLIKDNLDSKILGLLPSDMDGDGDTDIYVESKQVNDKNFLLINNGAQLTLADPKAFGLPETGIGASWLDYDNDGFTDFYIAPYGLYHQNKTQKFERTRLLNELAWYGPKIVGARSAWADMDNDGDRDLITVVKQTPSLPVRLINKLPKVDIGKDWQKVWVSKQYISSFSRQDNLKGNHWIEIDLTDSSGNAQAIGASVEIIAGELAQTQTVGFAENSYFSQGHYRLYFGLGEHTQADTVQITWPNGHIQKITALRADHLWKIEKDKTPTSIT